LNFINNINSLLYTWCDYCDRTWYENIW